MTMFGLCTLGSSLRFPEEMGNKGHAQCVAFVSMAQGVEITECGTYLCVRKFRLFWLACLKCGSRMHHTLLRCAVERSGYASHGALNVKTRKIIGQRPLNRTTSAIFSSYFPVTQLRL
jgi:hypothetical protein